MDTLRLEELGYRIPSIPKEPVVLDTSFWSKACTFNYDPYLWVVYQEPIWITQGIWNEIISAKARNGRIYPDALRMIQCVRAKQVQVFPGYFPSATGHPGKVDAEVMGLSIHVKATLLVDDRLAYQKAKSLGINVVTSPNFIALITHLGLIQAIKALNILNSLQNVIADELIRPAKRFVESLLASQEEAAPTNE